MVHHHHHHHHHEHGHDHGHAAANGRALSVALAITLAFALVEAVGGWWTGSLALLGDAGHMFSDAMALALAVFALWIARRPPSARHTYGLLRAEVVAALFNGLAMLLVVAGIGVEAVQRLRAPVPVAAQGVMIIAALGLAVNVGVLWVLRRSGENLSTRAAMLHVLGDLLGSVAALLAGVAIYFTGWMAADAWLSLLICALILYSTWRLLREVLHVLMEGVPTNLDVAVVGRTMAQVAGVRSVHDLHIWTLASGSLALSAHVVMDDLNRWPQVLHAEQELLHSRFDIAHVTLQPELGPPPLKGDYATVIPIHPQLRGER